MDMDLVLIERILREYDEHSSKYDQFLHDLAKENGALKSETIPHIKGFNYDSQKASYVEIDPKYNWSGWVMYAGPLEINLTPLVSALSITPMSARVAVNRISDNVYFIVRSNVPQEYTLPVMIHESIEGNRLASAYRCLSDHRLLMGDVIGQEAADADFEKCMAQERIESHTEGCFCELDHVFSSGEEFSKGYSEWLMMNNGNPSISNSYFHNAIPNFLAVHGGAAIDIVAQFYKEIFLRIIEKKQIGQEQLSPSYPHETHPWISKYVTIDQSL